MKKNLSRIFFIVSILTILAIFSNYQVRAEETEEIYESLLTNSEQEDTESVVNYAQYVTKSMSKTSYWKNKAKNVDKVLMTIDEIKALNKEIIDGSGTQVFDLEKIQTPIKVGIEKYYKNGELRQLYINGEKINQQEYITKYEEALSESKHPDGTKRGVKVFYAVATKRADLKVWPTDDVVGYSESDPDDETENHAINVNEPVVIRDVCNVDEKTFYYCQSKICTGWINADNLAICKSKDEWLDAWKIDITKKDFLVVLQDKITLEPSISQPQTSEVKLMLGTILKLVPDSDMPQGLGERGIWNNYVVYLPTRDENGNYVKQYALISEHYNVSEGFIPMTQSNILDVAFSCLGNRYGWGGMLGAMDCSAYTNAIYRCFGLEIPRNTTWQQKIPGRLTDISSMTDVEKQKYLETLPVGSLLYFPGHTMVYIGSNSGRNYVISATGSLSDSDGDLNVQSMYSVIINPLTTRRANGSTWLNNVNAVVTFAKSDFFEKELPFTDIKKDSWYYNAVNYVYRNNIIKGLNDTTYGPNEKLTRGMFVTILNRMEGNPKAKGISTFLDVKDSSKYYYNSVIWATENKIVSGYNNEKFGPNDNITRQQLAIMLWRYAKYKGKDLSASSDLKEFTDVNKISSNALVQMKWAVGVGIISGNANKTLNPKGNATRAEVAAMITNYCNKVGK